MPHLDVVVLAPAAGVELAAAGAESEPDAAESARRLVKLAVAGATGATGACFAGLTRGLAVVRGARTGRAR